MNYSNYLYFIIDLIPFPILAAASPEADLNRLWRSGVADADEAPAPPGAAHHSAFIPAGRPLLPDG